MANVIPIGEIESSGSSSKSAKSEIPQGDFSKTAHVPVRKNKTQEI